MSAPDVAAINSIITSLGAIVALIAGIVGLVKYFQETRRDRQVRLDDLAWRKTQFIIDLATGFDADEKYQRVFKLLSYGIGLPEGSSLSHVLEEDTSSLTQEEIEVRYSIDRYLDFFDRLYSYVFVTHAIKISDIETFSWHLQQIASNENVTNFARREGYKKVLELYMEVAK